MNTDNQGLDRVILESRIKKWLLTFGIAVGCIVLGTTLASDPAEGLVLVALAIGIIYGVVLAGQRWWLVTVFTAFFGGVFDLGGRQLYTGELGLVLVVGALLPSLAVQWTKLSQKRTGLPHIFRILGIYLICHLLVNDFSNKFTGTEGRLTAIRFHLGGLWPIIIIFLFHRFGSSKYVRHALSILLGVFALRACLGFLNYFTGFEGAIPSINFLAPGIGWTDFYDLRYSCPMLGLLASCYFSLHRNFLWRALNTLLFFVAALGVALGMGRAGMVLFLLVPVWWGFLHRQWATMVAFIGLIGLVVMFVNEDPRRLNALPQEAQRTFSVLLRDNNQSVTQADTESSDYWHRHLREIAWERWTESWHTLVFGTGIYRYPFDDSLTDFTNTPLWFENRMEAAARSGAYESGLLCVLSVTGLFGFFAYFATIIFLARKLLPVLWKQGVRDHVHALIYVAMFQILVWSLLSWTFGNFPSNELFLGFVASIALDDQRRKQDRNAGSVPSLPQLMPSTRTTYQRFSKVGKSRTV